MLWTKKVKGNKYFIKNASVYLSKYISNIFIDFKVMQMLVATQHIQHV